MTCKAIWLAAAAMVSVLPSTAIQAQERVVNVYNWSDYVDQSILADFTKETGIKVVYDVFDSNEMLETKLLAGGSGYDVVVPAATPFLVRQIAAGVYQKLDKSKLPNLKNMWDLVQEHVAAFDPGNVYSVNYMWGTVGIGYNPEKVKAALGIDKIDSWDVLFKPENIAKLKSCGVYVLDSPTDVIPTVLKYLGHDPADRSPKSLQEAETLLMSIRPSIRKFHSSEYINALANGDICAAIGFSGDVFQARNRAEEAKAGVSIAYTIPKEGAEMYFDQMAIPADAKDAPEALEFINYMMRPEVIAKSTNYVFYANGNKASQPLIDKKITSDPSIYPDQETLKKLFTIAPYDPKTQRVIIRIWTRVLTGQ